MLNWTHYSSPMKKLVVVLFALSLLSLPASAQWGIIGGLTSTHTSVKSSIADAKSINKFHVGVVYKFSLGKVFALQPGLIFNMKGSKLGDIGGVKDMDLKFKTGFLEVPVQLQAGATLFSGFRIYGLAEPFVGVAVSNRVNGKRTWDNIKHTVSYGLGLGFGVELFKHLEINLKYGWDFGSIYDSEFEWGDLKHQLNRNKCSGVSLSAVVLF